MSDKINLKTYMEITVDIWFSALLTGDSLWKLSDVSDPSSLATLLMTEMEPEARALEMLSDEDAKEIIDSSFFPCGSFSKSEPYKEGEDLYDYVYRVAETGDIYSEYLIDCLYSQIERRTLSWWDDERKDFLLKTYGSAPEGKRRIYMVNELDAPPFDYLYLTLGLVDAASYARRYFSKDYKGRTDWLDIQIFYKDVDKIDLSLPHTWQSSDAETKKIERGLWI